MKYFALILVLLISFCSWSQNYSFEWSKKFGGLYEDEGNHIAIDESGNIFMYGVFSDIISFDGIELTSQGQTDVYLLKADTSGNVLWAQSFGGAYSEITGDITIDNQGNIHIVGGFRSAAIQFGDTVLYSCGCSSYTFLAKFDNNGNFIWANSVLGESEVKCKAVASDNNGNVYIGGYHAGDIYFPNDTASGLDLPDIFLMKYNSEGTHVWSNRYASTMYESINDIAVSDEGVIHITGFFTNKIAFKNFHLHAAGSKDMFIVKLDSEGDVLWADNFGGSEYDEATSIFLDYNDNIFIAGYISDTVQLNDGELISNGHYDGVLVKISSEGELYWAKNFGGYTEDIVNDLAMDEFGNVFVTGRYIGEGNFGDTTLNTNLYSNAYFSCYDNDGNLLWIKQAGGPRNDEGQSIAVFDNVVYATGSIEDTTVFDSHGLISSGVSDIFLTKISDQEPLSINTIVSEIVDVHIYPVPSDNNIWIRFPESKDITGIVNIRTMDGKIISQIQVAKHLVSMDISQFSSGIYIAECLINGEIIHKKFIKL